MKEGGRGKETSFGVRAKDWCKKPRKTHGTKTGARRFRKGKLTGIEGERCVL